MGEDERTVRTAAELLRARTPTMAEAVHLATRIADAVAVLHDSGHVHGRLRADEVLLADDGAVALVGARLEVASTAVSRATDVRAVGRILAEALGADDPAAPLPAGIEDLVVRAERAEDAPAAALAIALRGLERDPAAAARLLPAPVPGSYLGGNALHLSAVVPRTARRRATVVACVVATIAAVGVALVVVGSPGTVTLRPVAQDLYSGLSTAEPTPSPTATAGERWSAKQRDETLRRLLGADLTGVPDALRPTTRSEAAAAAHRTPRSSAASPSSGSAPSVLAAPAPRSTGSRPVESAPTRSSAPASSRPSPAPTRSSPSGGSSAAPSGGGSSTPTRGGSEATPSGDGSSAAPSGGGSSSAPTTGGTSSAPGATTPSSGSSTSPSSAPSAPSSPRSTAPRGTSSSAGGTPTPTE